MSIRIKSKLIKYIINISGLLTIVILLALLTYIILMGLKNININMFAWKYTTDNASMMPAIINTIQLAFISITIATVIGVCSAIYLVEYAKDNSIFIKIIRLNIETLAGIPSIVYGLFGYMAFVVKMKLGYSILAGALTMSIMVLPLIIRTTEESLISIDSSYKEGSYALGAGKIRTIFKVIMPAILPGIFSGVILALGRVVGETAALIYTAGSVPNIANNALKSGRTLSVHMYALLSEGIYVKQAYATGVILLIFIIIINALAKLIFTKLNNRIK